MQQITPVSLASKPAIIDIEKALYCHSAQKNDSPPDRITTWTPSATQTYDSSGKPYDSDND
ncbi:hypothetical protein DPM18_04695 [Polynucleobacter paneuropaeus]|uniref:hypothetical protein n=1 Tax=Polynucleobacter paneuropaeus TaxID=2527775 RepID=UPI000DBEF95C|nr:hypothetical protein [Polynucleobacter paneuropaeus]AWW46166.1 hypothetical protein DPM18_04695 [Polynucleobacter paneuropaeus]